MSVSRSTRNKLALMSGNRCAMPSCRRLLAVTTPDSNGIDMLGEVAHIAGKHGGKSGRRPSARFDKKMTDKERDSLPNLLYVCRNCHAMIDAYPHGEQKYTVEVLLEIKEKHERWVTITMDEATADIGFSELEESTQWVNEVPPVSRKHDFNRIYIEEKIKKNSLSISSQNLITNRLMATHQVRSFIQSLSKEDPEFQDRLIYGFLEHYNKLRRDGITSGEDLFVRMCLFARQGFHDFRLQSAAETVLVYLFETCEVFEQ